MKRKAKMKTVLNTIPGNKITQQDQDGCEIFLKLRYNAQTEDVVNASIFNT